MAGKSKCRAWLEAYLRTILAGALLSVAGSSLADENSPADRATSESATSGSWSEMAECLAQFNRASALLEQYRYKDAQAAYESVLKQYPDWIAARFNLGLVYLNLEGQGGKQSQNATKLLDRARESFESVLAVDPEHLPAQFLLGIYAQHVGDDEAALGHYRAVHEHDRDDPFVTYKCAETSLRMGKTEEGIKLLERVVELDPGFISATYRLAQQYQRTGRRDRVRPLLERFTALRAGELAGGTFVAGEAYGESGKYYRALGADNLPLPTRPEGPQSRIVFSPTSQALDIQVRPWERSGRHIDLPGVAAGDVDGDGDLDLCITGCDARGTAMLFVNNGAGRFAPGARLAERGVMPVFGDVDNDGDLDLWLGRDGADQLLLNDGHGVFLATAAEIAGPDVLTSVARMLDIDSDGDLDLFAFRLERGGVPAAFPAESAPHSVWNNNRDGTWSDAASALGLAATAHSPVAACVTDDLDSDRDLDLLLFLAGEAAAVAWVNDRVGAFHTLDSATIACDATHVLGATSADVDKDGDPDVLVFTKAGVRLYTNLGRFRFELNEEFTSRHGGLGGTGGQFADMDNDGDLDLVIPDARRRDGQRGPVLLVNQWPRQSFRNAGESDPSHLLNALDVKRGASCVVADFTGNGRNDVLLAAFDAAPRLLENVTAGGHWLQLDLRGTETADKKTRSNNSAIGARVEFKTGAIIQQYTVGTSTGPVTTGPLRIHAGLGDNTKVDWLRILWPDAVLQAELELPVDRVTTITELQRKTSSCPYLFAWNGSRFEFVADFGGVGGLGYWLSPNTYALPDPTEYLRIPQLAPRDGQYVLQCLTPLEEVTYLDEAKLIAVDHPQGTQVHPNEMMAVGVSPPHFEVFCFDNQIAVERATDHLGSDVTEAIRKVDRRYAGTTAPDHRFQGLAERHFVDLDFGDRLGELQGDRRYVLCLDGWVEYGYSSTNYAAYQAGLRLEAPTISVRRDGRWVELFREVGYPAGIHHMMTLDLTHSLRPTDRQLRISSNMELYWDQIYLGEHRGGRINLHEIPVASADLHHLGYPREYSPDGRQPNLCDYGNLDRSVAWKLMAGDYTRYGDVASLLAEPDDCFVIMGHGDEVTLRFSTDDLERVPEGYERTFLLKSDSYCKDMDLATAFPDTVGPLPFHGMSGYPYAAEEAYPDTPKTRSYQRRFNTRRVGSP